MGCEPVGMGNRVQEMRETDYISKLVYHSNSKRDSRRGSSQERQQAPPERGKER